MKNLLLVLIMISCIKFQNVDESNTGNKDQVSFKYQMTSVVSFKFRPTHFDGVLPDGHAVDVMTEIPRNGGKLIKTTLVRNGFIDFKVSVITDLEFVYLKYNRIGFKEGDYLSLSSEVKTSFFESIINLIIPTAHALDSRVGDFDRDGVPLVMLDPINIDNSIIDSIENSLPESRPVPLYHPDYIVDDMSANICLSKDATGAITFIHEGAGYQNSLGFFTFDAMDVPQTEDDILDAKILFPNVSFLDSQRGMRTGYTLDLGNIEAGKCIGFFLVANGWYGSGVDLSRDRYFSLSHLNPELDSKYKNHNVLLVNEFESLFILGFEDLNREANSDDDFNDAVFSLEIDPYDAVSNIIDIRRTDIDKDTDKDGISDQFDDYPSDSLRAFDNFYPAEDSRGTLAFEDLWPSMGDYDFNDFMTYYNVRYITNSENKVKEIVFSFDLVATGASYRNGFAIELPVSVSSVESISGNSITSNYIKLNDNGTESGSLNTIVVIVDDVNDLLPKFTNVYHSNLIVEPFNVTVNVVFSDLVDLSILGTPPYKPFLIKNSNRGHEIHLAGNSPTSNFTGDSLFGQFDDNSLAGTLYINKDNMPWGINYPAEIPPIEERQSIRSVFPFFDSWANSKGFNFMDWYTERDGYRNTNKLIDITKR